MSPSGYIQSRHLASQSDDVRFATLVDDRPYLPNLTVDATDETSIRLAALTIVLLNGHNYKHVADDVDATDKTEDCAYRILHHDLNVESLKEAAKSLSCTKVTGGITNALYKISNLSSIANNLINTNQTLSSSFNDSILIRIFGAEGMIDRDIETSTYASLCQADIAHEYHGRFANGRIEGWLDGYIALQCEDLQCEDTSRMIAREMARLHGDFVVRGELCRHHKTEEVGLWNQLSNWTKQALSHATFRTEYDTERVRKLELVEIESEVQRFIELYTTNESTNTDDIAFCHNDMLAANIMRDPITKEIQLIDFEYGGTNYKAFDIANHFNEHAGGTTVREGGVPDYTKFPNVDRQKMFCLEYVKKVKEIERRNSGVLDNDDDGDDDGDVHQEAMSLLDQVKEFVLINHLYWGLWAVNQAAEEGCEEFDYIVYATNRFKQFYKQKEEWEKEE